MKRWTIHLIAGCCAIVTLLVLVHWVYSWFYMDRFQLRAGRSEITIGSAHGRVSVIIRRYVPEKLHGSFFSGAHDIHQNLREHPVPQVWYADHSFLGTGFGSARVKNSNRDFVQFHDRRILEITAEIARAKALGRDSTLSVKLRDSIRRSLTDMPRFVEMIVLPSWLLLMLFAALPTWWFPRALREHRRLRAGLCRRCGYDLRATPERCPECGAVPMAAKGGMG